MIIITRNTLNFLFNISFCSGAIGQGNGDSDGADDAFGFGDGSGTLGGRGAASLRNRTAPSSGDATINGIRDAYGDGDGSGVGYGTWTDIECPLG